MSGSETNLSVDEVVSAAARLAVSSDELRNRIANAVSQIRSIDPELACGADEPGRALLEAIDGTGGGTSATNSILDGSDTVCGETYALAEDTGVAAMESEIQDRDTASQIDRLAGELQAYGVTPSLLQDGATVDRINELQAMMADPGATELLGDSRVDEIEGFLSDVERLAE
jgi:hypothetical protein